MKHRKLLLPFIVLIGCGAVAFFLLWNGSSEGNELIAEPQQNPPSLMRAQFVNKTECDLGTVVFYYPGQADVSLNVPGYGTFESPEIREGRASAVKILGVTYQSNAVPAGMVCNGEDHTVYLSGPKYYDGHYCWDPWQLNGG